MGSSTPRGSTTVNGSWEREDVAFNSAVAGM